MLGDRLETALRGQFVVEDVVVDLPFCIKGRARDGVQPLLVAAVQRELARAHCRRDRHADLVVEAAVAAFGRADRLEFCERVVVLVGQHVELFAGRCNVSKVAAVAAVGERGVGRSGRAGRRDGEQDCGADCTGHAGGAERKDLLQGVHRFHRCTALS